MLNRLSKLQSFSLVLLRLLLAAWIGAAVLFVITSVAEQTSGHFDSRVRDQLAAIRFPHYYTFGFAIHGATLVLAFIVRSGKHGSRKTFNVVLGLIAASLVGIVLDYILVYQPLLELITPPGKVRTQEFTRLHNLSRYANQAHLMLIFVAAMLAAYPVYVDANSEHTA